MKDVIKIHPTDMYKILLSLPCGSVIDIYRTNSGELLEVCGKTYVQTTSK